MEDRQEYRWQLNDAKQIETIEQGEKLASQHLVEEWHDCKPIDALRCC